MLYALNQSSNNPSNILLPFSRNSLINRLRTETADVSKEEIDELQKGIEEAEKESANVKEVLAQ